ATVGQLQSLPRPVPPPRCLTCGQQASRPCLDPKLLPAIPPFLRYLVAVPREGRQEPSYQDGTRAGFRLLLVGRRHSAHRPLTGCTESRSRQPSNVIARRSIFIK